MTAPGFVAGNGEKASASLNVEDWPIERVIPYERNPRKNAGAVATFASSLREFGWRQPLVVDAAGVLIVGHTRLLAAKDLGMLRVPVHVAADLAPAKAKAYRIADNRSGEEAEWDDVLLGLELIDLKGLDFDLSLTGFDDSELTGLLSRRSAEVDDTDIEPPEEPKSIEGEIYHLGRHRLMCGDSTNLATVKRLLGEDRPAFAYQDPPYGIAIMKAAGTVGSGGRFRGVIGTGKIVPSNRYEQLIGDDSTKTAGGAVAVCRDMKIPTQVFWGANHYVEHLGNSASWVVWDKRDGQPSNDFADCELAWTNQKGAVRMFRHLWNGMMKASEKGQRRCHPTQKPVALAEWCFANYGKPGDIVFEGFSGSGAAIVAGERTGRTVLAMELSPAYCDVIRRRYAEFVNDPSLAP